MFCMMTSETTGGVAEVEVGVARSQPARSGRSNAAVLKIVCFIGFMTAMVISQPIAGGAELLCHPLRSWREAIC